MTTIQIVPPIVAPRPSVRPIVAVIQARLDSSRLPGKVLADIGGQPMLWRVVSRVQRATLLDRVIVATSQDPSDDPIAAFCAQRGVPCVRGSKTDVLDRYVQAARWAGAETIVRVTADCPLVDPAVIDRVVAEYLASGAEYVSNVLSHTYPDGLDLEVFAMDALLRSAAVATLPAEREHVTLHLRTSGLFTTRGVEQHQYPQARHHRWTVDEPQDLELIRAIYRRFGERPFGMNDVLALLEQEPEMLTLNRGLIRNEGYYRSLVAEPMVPARLRSLARSAALKARAERVIPSVSQTFSKAPT
ncbi:MAG: glycosyltransferase family protein, partial [Dehalococcoidia bacterium]|nr:glycosyltransferase family protein [Dehalococcoidia bacterium]